MRALTVAAEGRKADIAKPLKGFGSGVLEVALKHRTNAYRTVWSTLYSSRSGFGFCTPFRRRQSRAARPRRRISI